MKLRQERATAIRSTHVTPCGDLNVERRKRGRRWGEGKKKLAYRQ